MGVQLPAALAGTVLLSDQGRGLCEGARYWLAFEGVFFASFLFRRWKKK
jgi:hypothetical protein